MAYLPHRLTILPLLEAVDVAPGGVAVQMDRRVESRGSSAGGAQERPRRERDRLPPRTSLSAGLLLSLYGPSFGGMIEVCSRTYQVTSGRKSRGI